MELPRSQRGQKSERALITGGAGFIGSHLSEALLAKGYRVIALDDLSTGRHENIAHLVGRRGFRFVRGSVMDEATVDRLAAECDIIFHLAAAVGVRLIVADPLEGIETNVIGTHNVLRVAARYGTKVLIASTSEVYGKSERVPFGEDDDCLLGPTVASRWSYAASKALDEFMGFGYYRKTGLPVVVFRLFNTVGPRQTGRYGMVVPNFVQQAMRGEPLTVHGDGLQSRCFCDVSDAVRAIVALAECPQAAGRLFNIGSTYELTILDLARRVIDTVRRMSPSGNGNGGGGARRNGSHPGEDAIRFVPYDEVYGPDFQDIRRRVPDIRKIAGLTGWEPRITLDETLSRMVAFSQVASAV